LLVDKKDRAIRIIEVLRKATKRMVQPASFQITEKYGKDPYLIFISCLLSLRTKDAVSFPASVRLFEYAQTPEQMLTVPVATIEKLIYPTGFYRRKARLLHEVSADLIKRFKGNVPADLDDLLSIKGVGRKTANLVLGVAFDIPAICVDVHVHRVSNRLGLVQTKTTDETEQALMKLLPQEYWIEFNHLIVMWGQNICVPISPFCSKCAIAPLCPRIGVTRHR
jgi:endonuclease-3